jgi:hypothetical protein
LLLLFSSFRAIPVPSVADTGLSADLHIMLFQSRSRFFSC